MRNGNSRPRHCWWKLQKGRRQLVLFEMRSERLDACTFKTGYYTGYYKRAGVIELFVERLLGSPKRERRES
ncbi:MAG: hypothetical protein ACKVS6_03970 [Planctomycetota bacterium]